MDSPLEALSIIKKEKTIQNNSDIESNNNHSKSNKKKEEEINFEKSLELSKIENIENKMKTKDKNEDINISLNISDISIIKDNIITENNNNKHKPKITKEELNNIPLPIFSCIYCCNEEISFKHLSNEIISIKYLFQTSIYDLKQLDILISKNDQKQIDNKKIKPDIYFVGFQEVVKLNATNVIMTGDEKFQQVVSEWDKKVSESLQKIGKYKNFVIMNLVGINFFAYILEDKYDKLKNISKKIVKTGFGGATGNKGSCVINFDYENTSFSVSCSHLVHNNKNKRFKELEYILNLKLNTFYNPDKLKDATNQSLEEIMTSIEDDNTKILGPNLLINQNILNNTKVDTNNNNSLLFKDSDIWVVFGDLNFRVDTEYEEFSDFIKKGIIIKFIININNIFFWI